MPSFIKNADGSTTHISRYNTKGILTLTAIFPSSPVTSAKYIKKRKGVKCELQRKYVIHDNSTLVRIIFARLLIKIMERVADGDMFIFPGVTEANITLKPIADKYAKRARQLGCYSDFDIVKANFKIPVFRVDFGPFSDRRDFEIYVPKEISDRALRNAENGVIPWLFKPKTYNRDVQYE